jgi:chlorite dismutase
VAINDALFFLSLSLNIKSDSGLRLVELRNDADGMVFHHWEFLSETPPCQFALKRSRLKHLPEKCSVVVALAEDSYGNIMKKRINLDKIV